MKKKMRTIVILAGLLLTISSQAQRLIKGRVIDAETREELIGATVIIDGTTQGVATDINGQFELEIKKSGKVNITLRSVGYNEIKKEISPKTKITDLGTLSLVQNAVGLDEVAVIASVVRPDRLTPIAVSNVKFNTIEEKLGGQEFPEILKQTPSMYVTKSSGGYGDSRIALRGFDSNNIGVLVNGIPVNDMENGKVYWSNWAGLSDVTQFMQVQRGLGASKLGLSSAGGTVNIITRSTDSKRGGTVSTSIGNDGLNRESIALSTGLTNNGWSISVLLGRNMSNGYVFGTNYEGYTYFLNISKVINESHRLSLTGFGSPQWHNQRGVMHTVEDWETKRHGVKYNATYGMYNGEVTGGPYGYNEYHKPQMSLNHSWQINDKSTLNTSAYASISYGGGRRTRSSAKAYTNWLSYDSNTGRPYLEGNSYGQTMATEDGQLDYGYVIGQNSEGETSKLVFTEAVNSHKWFGILSSYNNQLTENINITAGYDGRYYKGDHYEEVEDLLGGKGFIEQYPLYGREKGTIIGVGDKTNYHNLGEIFWQGIFGQAEYASDNISAFLNASLTYEGYRYHALDKAPLENGSQISNLQSFMPFSTKAGFNWNILENNNIFINGGYFTRAPYFSNVFKNYTAIAFDEKPYEKIMTFEGGYTYSSKAFTATINAYYTEWMDRGKAVTVTNDGTTGRGILRGLDARHTGVEIETLYHPIKDIEIKGMLSLGDWIYTDNVSTAIYDDNQNFVKDYNAYIKDVHVGNAAQMTANMGIYWEAYKGLKLGADWNFAGKNYADFDPTYRTKETDNFDSWKMPNYSTFDVNASYRFRFSNATSLSFFLNGNNILNEKYIADAKEATVDKQSTALVYYGFGRTWSIGMKYTF